MNARAVQGIQGMSKQRCLACADLAGENHKALTRRDAVLERREGLQRLRHHEQEARVWINREGIAFQVEELLVHGQLCAPAT